MTLPACFTASPPVSSLGLTRSFRGINIIDQSIRTYVNNHDHVAGLAIGFSREIHRRNSASTIKVFGSEVRAQRICCAPEQITTLLPLQRPPRHFALMRAGGSFFPFSLQRRFSRRARGFAPLTIRVFRPRPASTRSTRPRSMSQRPFDNVRGGLSGRRGGHPMGPGRAGTPLAAPIKKRPPSSGAVQAGSGGDEVQAGGSAPCDNPSGNLSDLKGREQSPMNLS